MALSTPTLSDSYASGIGHFPPASEGEVTLNSSMPGQIDVIDDMIAASRQNVGSNTHLERAETRRLL